MMNFLLTAATAEKTTNAVKSLASGNTQRVEQLIQQGIDFCVDAGKTLLLAIVIYLVGRFAIKILNNLLSKALERRDLDPSIKSFLKSSVNILLTVLLVIAVVSALGVNTTSFAALLASVGVAAGMALSGNLSNFAGGLIILLLKPFKVGDYVEAQGVAGTVCDIQIFHTLLTTVDNKTIFLPNGALSSGNIIHYSRQSRRRVNIAINVEYGQDIEKAKALLFDLFKKDQRILQEPAPFVAVSALAESSVVLTVRLWTEAANYWGVFFDTQEAIYAEFNKQGISFPFPQLTVHQA